jgi:hypothetical protein
MRALTRVLNAVQRLIEHTEGEGPELEPAEEEEAAHAAAPLHLIDVVSRSAAYPVAARDPREAIRIVTETGKTLRDPSGTDWDPEILSPIEDLSEVAKSLHCNIELRRPGKDGRVLARITPQSYEEMAETAFVKGESSVYGYLERIGGAVKRHCGLRMPSQPAKMIICPVQTEALVRELGRHVYQHVRVFGTVTWFRRTWQVKSVSVTGFEPSKSGSILRALERIYEAGGKAWDDVADAEGLLAEMRKA